MSDLNNQDNEAISTLNGAFEKLQVDEMRARYEEERQKRLRDDGNAQFIQVEQSANCKRFAEDPWADPADIQPLEAKFPDKRSEMLIIGAGWGGIQIAVRMIEAGIPAQDIRMIDPAGGFGGTWYWNRFPGLMCDIESYSYLPFLEETGYVPKHRYSYGEEIRQYANLVAKKWGLVDSAVFKTQAKEAVWDDGAKEWIVQLIQRQKDSQGTESVETLEIRSKFVTISTGPLNWPKLPNIPGILDYKGGIFHAARWAYDVTGGSPTDSSLTNLKVRPDRWSQARSHTKQLNRTRMLRLLAQEAHQWKLFHTSQSGASTSMSFNEHQHQWASVISERQMKNGSARRSQGQKVLK